MAHHQSAKKSIRQTRTRTEVNKMRVQRIRTFIRYVRDAIGRGDADAARAALRVVEPEIMRGAQKGVWKKKTASRTVSRLNGHVKRLVLSPSP